MKILKADGFVRFFPLAHLYRKTVCRFEPTFNEIGQETQVLFAFSVFRSKVTVTLTLDSNCSPVRRKTQGYERKAHKTFSKRSDTNYAHGGGAKFSISHPDSNP